MSAAVQVALEDIVTAVAVTDIQATKLPMSNHKMHIYIIIIMK